MDAVFSEIMSGVVPPVGGRIVDVPTTGEVAFVAFGSAIIQTASQPPALARNRRNAEKIAMMRAEAELCGILTGDTVEGRSEYREAVSRELGDYESIEKGDPMNTLASSQDVEAVKSAKETFSHNQQFAEIITTARNGTVPHGVSRITWSDDDSAWAYGVTVYVPSITNRAASDAERMRTNQILKPVETEQSKQKAKQKADREKEEASKFKPGATGTIQQNL